VIYRVIISVKTRAIDIFGKGHWPSNNCFNPWVDLWKSWGISSHSGPVSLTFNLSALLKDRRQAHPLGTANQGSRIPDLRLHLISWNLYFAWKCHLTANQLSKSVKLCYSDNMWRICPAISGERPRWRKDSSGECRRILNGVATSTLPPTLRWQVNKSQEKKSDLSNGGR